MQCTITKIDGAYNVKNLRIRGHFCKTNIPSNTAFRGYGAPQAIAIVENVIDVISSALRISPEKVN